MYSTPSPRFRRSSRKGRASLHGDAHALRERRAGIADVLGSGLLTGVDAGHQRKRRRVQIESVERQIDAATRAAFALSTEELQGNLDGLSLDRRRALTNALMTVTLHGAPRGGKPSAAKPSGSNGVAQTAH